MIEARCCAALLIGLAGSSSASGTDRSISTVSLTQAFETRSPWSLAVTQSSVPGESGTGDPEPGVVTPCLRQSGTVACDPALSARLDRAETHSDFDLPHYLRSARVAYRPSGGRELLLIVVLASIHAGNGGQLVRTQALAYRPNSDRFVRLFEHSTGTNNNQEVRFVESGPLGGDFIEVEPTADAPFGYWVTVTRSDGETRPYRTVLRYRSTTRYGDGNALPVIDSEMPIILRRLGLWRPGQKLPLPASGCPKPNLKGSELWCT